MSGNGKAAATLAGRGLVKSYGSRRVVDGIDVEVHAGEIVGLLGPNGAGKTTTFYMLVGMIKPNAGRVLLEGEDVSRLPMYRRARRGVGYLPQEPSVFRRLTVEENMTAVAQPGPWTVARVYEMFPRLKERRNNSGNQLSGGEQQMLAIGRALTLNPQVLLLDEPTEGLAPIIVEELLRALGTITRSGGICSIIVEQNAQKILGLADRVVILERGAIVHDAASAALKADPAVLERFLGVSGAAAH